VPDESTSQRHCCGLPRSFRGAVAIVQHVDPRFAAPMGEWLAHHSTVPVQLGSTTPLTVTMSASQVTLGERVDSAFVATGDHNSSGILGDFGHHCFQRCYVFFTGRQNFIGPRKDDRLDGFELELTAFEKVANVAGGARSSQDRSFSQESACPACGGYWNQLYSSWSRQAQNRFGQRHSGFRV